MRGATLGAKRCESGVGAGRNATKMSEAIGARRARGEGVRS